MPATPALLLVDLQRCMAEPRPVARNNPDAEAHLAALLAHWRARGWPLVHIRHISRDPASGFAPGQPGVVFQAAFEPLPHEQVLEKNVPDAFVSGALERWLRIRGLDRLVIAGVISENSLEATARSAGNLGFIAQVPEDACFTFAKADFRGRPRSAEEVHDMAMANLHGEYAEVLSTRAVLDRWA